MGAIASQITSLTIVYLTVYSGADQSKHQSSASLAFVWGIHRGPVNSPHKWPVTRKMFPLDDVIMALWHCHHFTPDYYITVSRYSRAWYSQQSLDVIPWNWMTVIYLKHVTIIACTNRNTTLLMYYNSLRHNNRCIHEMLVYLKWGIMSLWFNSVPQLDILKSFFEENAKIFYSNGA